MSTIEAWNGLLIRHLKIVHIVRIVRGVEKMVYLLLNLNKYLYNTYVVIYVKYV